MVEALNPGERAVAWISRLTLCDDFQGKPFDLQAWQADPIRKLFGTITPEGIRQYKTLLLMLPRKQGKTQLIAAVATYLLLGEPKTGQSIVCAAADIDQASHLFKKVVEMIEADPYLSKQVIILHGRRTITAKRSGNTLKVVSSEGRRQLGLNPSVVIIDELLAQPDRRLYDALLSAQAARKEPLVILISTAGNSKDTLVGTEYDYGKKVEADPSINPTYLPVIFEAQATDDWSDEAVWHKAMPALGSFVGIDYFRDAYRKAKDSPPDEAAFKQYYLNMWISAESKWINQVKWSVCGMHTFDPKQLLGRKSFWGLDLSNTSDVTALVGIFPMDDGTFRVLPHFWIPENYAIAKDRKGGTKYKSWNEKGLITFTSGDEIDYPLIEEQIPIILKNYKCKQVFTDPYNATSTIQRLTTLRIPVSRYRQGWQSMNDPIKYTGVLISKGQLHHNNHAVLDWMARNVVVNRDQQDNYTFDKLHSDDKIDGIVALTMGVAGWLHSSKTLNVYETMNLGKPKDMDT